MDQAIARAEKSGIPVRKICAECLPGDRAVQGEFTIDITDKTQEILGADKDFLERLARDHIKNERKSQSIAG